MEVKGEENLVEHVPGVEEWKPEPMHRFSWVVESLGGAEHMERSQGYGEKNDWPLVIPPSGGTTRKWALGLEPFFLKK